MSKIHVFVGYNNYFNRTVKKEISISDYASKALWSYSFDSSNFNENDGIYAQHTINWPTGTTPDYLIVAEGDLIKSRWFITEWKKNRGGQFNAKLRRDVVVDFFDSIIDSPCFIERGPLKADSKLLFNPEGFSLNRIKKEEILLKDETGTQWIVGYLDREAPETTVSSIFHEEDYPTLDSLGIILNSPTNPLNGGRIKAINDENILPEIRMRVRHIQERNTRYSEARFKTSITGIGTTGDDYFFAEGSWGQISGRGTLNNRAGNKINFSAAALAWKESFSSVARTAGLFSDFFNSMQAEDGDLTTYSNLKKVNDGVIVIHNGKYYRMIVTSQTANVKYRDIPSTGNFASVYYGLENVFGEWKDSDAVSPHITGEQEILGIPYDMGYEEVAMELSFSEIIPPGVLTTKISTNRNHLDDAPYDMFCLPFGKSELALAQSIAVEMGAHVKDLQILPFCPARFILEEGVLTEGTDYSKITKNSVEVGRMYYCRTSSASLNIDVSIKKKYRSTDEAENIKLSNECDVYRLTAPNYSSSFEFSVAKNGDVEGFKATFTYRPISPYIHVQPIFSGLYGNVNNDARGLICGGDFSVDMLSDAFVNYQITNKNFENIFNSQIKRMDDLRHYQRISSIASGIAGVFQGMSSGGSAGGIPFQIPGAIIGAGVGGVASGIGAAIDYANQEAAYGINRQFSVDMYNYNLGNVQAVPDTLTKVSAYNIDNKYFPIVEVYSCTEEEVEFVWNKITYQSFSIQGISTIYELIGEEITGERFVKGQMIRMVDNGFYGDEHIANEIYAEIAKGVYL